MFREELSRNSFDQVTFPLFIKEGLGEIYKRIKMKPYNKNLKQSSRDLRNHMTEAEKLLWSKLRGKQILGLQFYRQKPILNFIVDFYCPVANLVIECDGGQHFTDEGLKVDRIRDEALAQLGLKVLRFDNGQVLKQIDNVVHEIHNTLYIK